LGRTKWRKDGVRINALQFNAGRHQLDLSPTNTTLIGGSNLISLDEVVTPNSLELYIDRKSEVNLPIEADLIATADDGFAVASISKPNPDHVKVVGPRSLLGGFNTIYTEHKKMTGLRNSLEISLPLALPSSYGITLDPDSVTLSLEVVPIRTKLFERVPIVLYNLPIDSLAISQPNQINVILTGPPDMIDSLEISSLIASADFAARDSSGRVAVKVDCPANFRVKSVSVDSVTINRL
jgi:YbbR domain-containing protein